MGEDQTITMKRTVMKTNQQAGLLALILCLAFAGSCGWNLKRKITGKWDNYFGGPTMEFKSDGAILVLTKGPNGQQKTMDTGTYKALDGETLEISWATKADRPDRIKVKFKDEGKLVMTLPDGSQRVYVRGS
jgi:hypothetical protein